MSTPSLPVADEEPDPQDTRKVGNGLIALGTLLCFCGAVIAQGMLKPDYLLGGGQLGDMAVVPLAGLLSIGAGIVYRRMHARPPA